MCIVWANTKVVNQLDVMEKVSEQVMPSLSLNPKMKRRRRLDMYFQSRGTKKSPTSQRVDPTRSPAKPHKQ